MEMIIAKVQEIINSVLEIIKTWEIGDYIFVGVDVLLVIIILCLLSRRSRRKRKEKKALKRQKLNAVEVNNETIVEEVVESPIIEETPVVSEEQLVEETKVVEEVVTPDVKEEKVEKPKKKKESTSKPKKPTPTKKEPVRPEKAKKLMEEAKEEEYNSSSPFEKVTISLPDKVNYRLGKGWESLFRRARRNETFKNDVWPFVYNSYLENKQVTPEKDNLFKPFEYCDPCHTKVVFVNKQTSLTLEDEGLAFSTSQIGQKTPMFNELYNEARRDREVRAIRYDDGSLKKYAKQGVFLYNYILTNAVGESRKHETLGWDTFSNMVIKDLAKDPSPKVFVLFGSYVNNQVSEIITKNSNHKIIVVPSIHKINGSNLFSEINEYLVANKVNPINWSLGKIRK